MTVGGVHLLCNSSWKFHQLAAGQPLSGQPVRYGPSITYKIIPAWSLSTNQPSEPPCWAIPLAFGLIGPSLLPTFPATRLWCIPLCVLNKSMYCSYICCIYRIPKWRELVFCGTCELQNILYRGGSFKEIELSRLRYSWLRFGLASAGYRGLRVMIGRCTQPAKSELIPQSMMRYLGLACLA